MSKLRTHYDNLKVSRDAPPEIIKAAYKVLSQKYHPDKNPGNTRAAKIMVIINDSYSVLSDPDKRKKHDEWIAGYETKSPHRGSGTRQDHEEWQSKRTEERNERRRRGSVNTYDKDGYTPLMRAVKQMDIDAVRDLLELGADPKLEDANFGTSTALSMARRLFSISKDSRARSIYQDIINILKPIT